jgi:hypothetical protein
MNLPHEEREPEPRNGKIVLVQLKTWFDPSTVSAHRGNGPLMPGRRKVWLIDSRGRRFAQSPKTDALLARNGLRSRPLHTALRPGEWYDSYLVFETPLDAHDLRLLVTSAEDFGSAIWGHENSPFHAKAYFGIPSPASARIANL